MDPSPSHLNTPPPPDSTNDMWYFDLTTSTWTEVVLNGVEAPAVNEVGCGQCGVSELNVWAWIFHISQNYNRLGLSTLFPKKLYFSVSEGDNR